MNSSGFMQLAEKPLGFPDREIVQVIFLQALNEFSGSSG